MINQRVNPIKTTKTAALGSQFSAVEPTVTRMAASRVTERGHATRFGVEDIHNIYVYGYTYIYIWVNYNNSLT